MLDWHCQSTISYQATGHTHSSVRASSPHGRASPGSKTKTPEFLKFPKAPENSNSTTRRLWSVKKKVPRQSKCRPRPIFWKIFFFGKKLTLQGINISPLIRHIWRWFSFSPGGICEFPGGYLNCISSAFPRLSAMPPRQASNARASAGRPRWDLKFCWENMEETQEGIFHEFQASTASWWGVKVWSFFFWPKTLSWCKGTLTLYWKDMSVMQFFWLKYVSTMFKYT